MKIELEGKVALVTGAGQGIGEAIARTLASHGARVVYADMNLETAKASAAKSKGAVPLLMDVTKPADIEAAVAKIEKDCGQIDILVNNAGIGVPGEFRANVDQFSPEMWDKLLKVDLTGVFLCSRAVSQMMIRKKTGGRIVNIASALGIIPARLQCGYTAAKGGVVQLSKTMAIELANQNILVNCVCPGTMENVYRTGSSLAVVGDRILSHVPMGRPGTFTDIANAVAFLVAPEASYITGQVLAVDGGWTCGGFFRDF